MTLIWEFQKKLGSCFIYGLFHRYFSTVPKSLSTLSRPKKIQHGPGSLEAEVQQDTMQLEQQKAKRAFATRPGTYFVDGTEIRRYNQLIWLAISHLSIIYYEFYIFQVVSWISPINSSLFFSLFQAGFGWLRCNGWLFGVSI